MLELRALELVGQADLIVEARDARADWATQTTREGELLQATAAELSPESVSDHMGRMFLGGFAKKLRQPASRGTSSDKRP